MGASTSKMYSSTRTSTEYIGPRSANELMLCMQDECMYVCMYVYIICMYARHGIK